METVRFFLVVPGIEVELGTAPAAAGIYTWNVEISEFPVPAGEGYRFKIGGSYDGEFITKISNEFAVKDCGVELKKNQG